MTAELVQMMQRNLEAKLSDEELEDWLRQRGITDDELHSLWREKRNILKEAENGCGIQGTQD